MNGTTDPSFDPTPGVQTSEGRLTIAMSIVGVALLVLDVLHPGFKIDPETKRDVATILSLALPGMVAAYQHARAKVKVAATQAKAQLQVQKVQQETMQIQVAGEDRRSLRHPDAGTATTVAREDMQHHRG